jgi:hypothetical protein
MRPSSISMMRFGSCIKKLPKRMPVLNEKSFAALKQLLLKQLRHHQHRAAELF